MDPNKMEVKRNSDGTFAEGGVGGPGRPKGKTLKEFAREYFMLKTDEEKIAYIENLEKVKPGFAWTMGEGNPKNESDVSIKELPIIHIAEEIANKNDITPIPEDHS